MSELDEANPWCRLSEAAEAKNAQRRASPSLSELDEANLRCRLSEAAEAKMAPRRASPRVKA